MNSLLGVAGLGSIGLLWGQIQAFFSRIRALVIVKAHFPDEVDAAAISLHLQSTYKVFDIGDRTYAWARDFIRPLDRYGIVPHERIGKIQVYLDGWKPIVVYRNDVAPGQWSGYNVSFIRGTFSLKDIFVKSCLAWDEKTNGGKSGGSRFRIKRVFGKNITKGMSNIGNPAAEKSVPEGNDEANGPCNSLNILHYSREDIGPRIVSKPFDRLAYSPSVLEFEREIRRWYKSEKWFKERGLPWRFGGGLFSKPGCGKTSFVRAIAQDLDMPIHSYDLTNMSNEELVEKWEESLSATPCIVLFEDIDRIFDQDEKVQGSDSKAPLTMDCLLNCISGVQTADGILVMITANDVTKLDSALGVPDETGKSSRPGRLDRCVWFGPPDEAGRRSIANRILKGYDHLIEKTVKEGEGETGAQFESRCCKLALEMYWTDKTVGVT